MAREVEFEPLSNRPVVEDEWAGVVDQDKIERYHESISTFLEDEPNLEDEMWAGVVDQSKINGAYESFYALLRGEEVKVAGDTEQESEEDPDSRGLLSELGRTGLAASFLVTVNAYRAVAKVCRIDSSGIL